MMRILLYIFIFLFTSISPSLSSELSLQADELIYSDENARIIARGDVTMEYQGRSVRAGEIIYDQHTRRVKASGSVELIDANGDILTADELDITDNFSDGFIKSLEVETKDKTYFSASHAEQLSGSTIFYNGVYTPCERCVDKPDSPATWQVKASKITVDGNDRTISYEDASFELFGIPVAYIPRFSHSDPSMTRKDGFLVPSVEFDEDLGSSYHQSYFKTLGDYADAKFTLSNYANQGLLPRVDLRRQFTKGLIELTVAGFEQDSPTKFTGAPDNVVDDRAMLGTKAEFQIDDHWTTGWDILFQSDDSFANTYNILGYSDVTVTNELYLRGLGERSSFSLASYYYDVQGTNYQVEDQQAVIHPVLDYHRIVSVPELGGDLSLDMNMTSLSRRDLSEFPTTQTSSASLFETLNRDLRDLDRRGISDRSRRVYGIQGDVSRLSANIDWRRSLIFSGFSVTPNLGIYADVIQLTNESNYTTYNLSEAREGRILPKASLEVGYPLLVEMGISNHIVEPIVQLIGRPNLSSLNPLPNEDSQSLVFDTTTLFDHDKFSGYDRIESGSRINYGIRYSGIFGSGMTLTGLLGQSYHLGGDNPYLSSDLANAGLESGLEGDRTDYVASLGATFPLIGLSYSLPSLHFQGRFGESDFSAKRVESSFNLSSDSWEFGSHYAFINGQPLSGFASTREQLTSEGRLKFSGNWHIFGSKSYDIENSSSITDRIGVGYDDSCLTFSLTYAQTDNLYSATENDKSIGFKISLRALGVFKDDE